MRDRLDPARVAMREAGRIRADIESRQATAQRIASAMSRPGQPDTVWERRERGVDGRTSLALDRVMERVHAGDPMTLSAIREHGFPEVLREEGLRVIMDEDQAVRAKADAETYGTRQWGPPPS